MNQSSNKGKISEFKGNNNEQNNGQIIFPLNSNNLLENICFENGAENKDETIYEIFGDYNNNQYQSDNNSYYYRFYDVLDRVNMDQYIFPIDNISNPDILTTRFTSKKEKTKMKTNKYVFFTIKKRDRVPKLAINSRRKFHDDNIKKKIKSDFFKFIIFFINIILKEFTKKNNITFDSVFYKLSHMYNCNVTHNSINSLQNQTIKNIITSELSPQYSSKNKNANLITCKKIESEKKLKDFDNMLNKNILYIFETIYFPKRKEKYFLNQLGLIDLEIILDKKDIGLFEDLLEKNNKNEENFNFDEYKECMIKCCKNYFFQKKNNIIFKTIQTK